MNPKNKALVEAIANANLAPSEKRKALAYLGIKTEYMPHQGKREIARRLSKIQQGRA